MVVLANIQISTPAGAAIMTARPNTKRVRSRIERIITFPICGLRYGGSSSAKDDGIPFSKVEESTLEVRRVAMMPSMMINDRIAADNRLPLIPDVMPTKNMVDRTIRVGNLPLHGMKLLVRIAMSRSLGESMILHPITPTELQPSPMHMVRACFPQALHFWKE